ncbi:MAG: quinone-dependent dihydroorotate dehydrogenase [Balneolales bacterium]|nr:quinone-dependent dihydroorotate dehydrogenase [Balneolales bacterium]
MIYKNVLLPLFFRADPESVHDAIYRLGRWVNQSDAACNAVESIFKKDFPLLKQEVFGLKFDNPVGLAAGFDKNGYLPRSVQALGFGFTEIGSVSALRSDGNPKPRMFRLPHDEALVNRMGLNNEGAKAVANRLLTAVRPTSPVGINIAKTHSPAIMGDLAILDYVQSFLEARKVADYITINISCPNTEEGKTFEDVESLNKLLSAIDKAHVGNRTPLLVKLSADLDKIALEELVRCCETHQIDGYVAVNTSANRDELPQTEASDIARIGRGGLSGKPLFSRSLKTVERISELTNQRKAIIGVGGIDSSDAAIEMFKAGASLIQLYSGLIYKGPFLIRQINNGLERYLKSHGLNSLSELRGYKSIEILK